MQDAFGIDREAIAKKMTEAGARVLAATTGKESALATRLRLRRPTAALRPSNEAAGAGDQAATDGMMAVRGRAERRRKLKYAGGTAALATGSGGAVLGVDALTGHNKKKNGRPHL